MTLQNLLMNMMQLISTARIGCYLILLTLVTEPAFAAIRPASVFTDNMVLQRGQRIPVWGTADPKAEIGVQLGQARAKCTADSAGRWMATLEPLAASTVPRSLEIRGGEDQVSLANVLVGDVWLCSGQSNMQMTLRDSAGGKKFARRYGDDPRIRLLVVPKQFNANTVSALEGKWTVAIPELAEQFSAVGFSYGATLAASPAMREIPIGLIDSSFGGTAAEAWIPAGDLKPFDANQLGNSMFGQPTEHYNAMIHPLVPMAIRGVVWYQGESNSDRPAMYAKLLNTLISSWRREFRHPDLPFIIIQLPAYNAPFSRHFYTWIREQQAIVAATTKGVSLVVTHDTHDGSDLHPAEKIPIGRRAGKIARAIYFGEQIASSGPTYKSHSIDGSRVNVVFDTHGRRLITSDNAKFVRGFQLAGSNSEYRFATGSITGRDTVTVSSSWIAAPKTVRFAWEAVPNTNLVDSAHLPAAPFRTDSLPPDDVAFVRAPIHRAVKTTAYELEIDGNGSLRSLGIGGEQFIANDLAMNGGSCIPAFLGSHNLTRIREVSPKQISFCDTEVGVTFSFASDRVNLEVKNGSTSGIVFQIALAPGVAIDPKDSNQLHKRNAILQTKGFDSPTAPLDGKLLLKATVPAGEIRSLELRAVEQPQ